MINSFFFLKKKEVLPFSLFTLSPSFVKFKADSVSDAIKWEFAFESKTKIIIIRKLKPKIFSKYVKFELQSSMLKPTYRWFKGKIIYTVTNRIADVCQSPGGCNAHLR